MYKLISTLTVAFTLTACGGLDTTFTYVGEDAEPALTSCQMLENGLTVCLDYDASCYAEDHDTVVCNTKPEPVDHARPIGEILAPRVESADRLADLDIVDGLDTTNALPELSPQFIQEACEACPGCAHNNCIACHICSAARNHHQLIDDDRFDADANDRFDGDIDEDNANAPDHTSSW